VIVLVHGVPETAAIWRKVQDAIDRPSVALSLPGFGSERPQGFGATRDEYVAWLVEELEALGEPADLVGHDWGAILTYRIAGAHSDRLRSWAADCGNLAHPDHRWHPIAEIWQQPEQGEAFMEAGRATPVEDRAQALAATMGISLEDAMEMAVGEDLTMDACILDLYRSALPNPHHLWGPWSRTEVPGLVLHAEHDPFSDEAMAREAADLFGARFEVLPEAGHFWPYQTPDAAAAVLTAYWDSLPA
jgi:pimeloyl-ACP methyl ester carboxylesterase